MELNIDTGVEEFRVNGRGVLRFNPADPNLYHRFFAAGAELDGYDAALTKALAALDGDEQQRAAAGLALLNEYDGKIKKLLTGIFGAENDFDAILGGVNLAGVGANGKRVVQNLLEALTPILRETVNYVNAKVIAQERGIEVIESKAEQIQDFANLIIVDVVSDNATSRGQVAMGAWVHAAKQVLSKAQLFDVALSPVDRDPLKLTSNWPKVAVQIESRMEGYTRMLAVDPAQPVPDTLYNFDYN